MTTQARITGQDGNRLAERLIYKSDEVRNWVGRKTISTPRPVRVLILPRRCRKPKSPRCRLPNPSLVLTAFFVVKTVYQLLQNARMKRRALQRFEWAENRSISLSGCYFTGPGERGRFACRLRRLAGAFSDPCVGRAAERGTRDGRAPRSSNQSLTQSLLLRYHNALPTRNSEPPSVVTHL